MRGQLHRTALHKWPGCAGPGKYYTEIVFSLEESVERRELEFVVILHSSFSLDKYPVCSTTVLHMHKEFGN